MEHRLLVLHINTWAEKKLTINPAAYPGVELIDFQISYDSQVRTDFNLLHSMASTPARYLEMAIARVGELKAAGGDLLVFNPTSKCSDFGLEDVISREAGGAKQITVVADMLDRPIAYLFPANVIDRLLADHEMLGRLRYLSCTSGVLDVAMLEDALGSPVRLSVKNIDLEFETNAGFLWHGWRGIYGLTAMHAQRAFKTGNTVERIAVMPYHAGDVLFFLKALGSVKHDFTHLLICKEFVAVAKKMVPDLNLIVVEDSCIARGVNLDPEATTHGNREDLYFYNILYPCIPKNALFYYFRLCRNYNHATAHMIDQWKVSLTNDWFPIVSEDFVPVDRQPPQQKSVFIHFDGGWPLKIYDSKDQNELISLLKENGFQVSVLTDRPGNYDCAVFPFGNLTLLEERIRNHAIFVGMDSFPVHFAAHVLKHPALCLFSSTRPENSNATPSTRYRAMNRNMSCSPCNGQDICPRYSKPTCANFSSPQEVVAVIKEMFSNLYGGALA
jgi:hypothetical protein